MLSFINWLGENSIKQKRKKKNERSNCQSGQENGTIDNEGQANRYDQEIPTTIVHYFSEP